MHAELPVPDAPTSLELQARGSEQLDRRRRYTILAICCLSLFIVGLDNTIVNVALPRIGHDLHASVSGLQWTVDAYIVVIATLLMLSGSTADRLGRRRTFETGLALFSLGSLLCSLAPSLPFLVAFRMLQAVGGSMLNPVAMSIITNTFVDRAERARAIGVWGAVYGMSMALGPVLGGALVSSVGWRSIFWINIPVGVAALVLTARFVPESRAAVTRRVDVGGQVLVALLLAALTFGIIEGPDAGWGSVRTAVVLGVAAVALAGFVVRERRAAEPLVDLRFFRSVPFSGATVVAVASFAALGGFLFQNTLYLQEVRGLSPFHAGLDTAPLALVMIVSAPISGAVVASWGPRLPLVVGGVGIATSAALLTTMSASTSFTQLFLSYFSFGVGFGFVNAPITNTAVSGMPRAQAGVAAGIASTTRQVGQSLGVAVIGALAASSLHGPLRVGFPAATHTGWWTVLGCGVVIAALGLATTSKAAFETARQAAARLMPVEEGWQ